MICTSGSPISSITDLSSSVSSPDSYQFDLLAAVAGKIAHQSRKFGEHFADRLHAHLHHGHLQFGRDVVQRRGRLIELFRKGRIGDFVGHAD